jgi:peptidoglycan hydrolase CwlO-like protein
MTVPSFPQVVNTTTVETSMTDADLAVALHFARNGSPEGHRVEALETYIAALKEVVANAKEEIEQTRQKADALSRQLAGQSAANDKLQAELDNLRAGINAYWQQVVRNLCS